LNFQLDVQLTLPIPPSVGKMKQRVWARAYAEPAVSSRTDVILLYMLAVYEPAIRPMSVLCG